MKLKRLKEIIGFGSIILSAFIVVLILGIIIFDITAKGIGTISWQFLIDFPRDGMTKGGILPAIIGTIYVTFITALFSIPFGVSCAIYLSEYAKEGKLTSFIRAALKNLAGVPSIIYGLFGVALFVHALQFGTSILSSGLTLGLLTLPWIVTASEEAIKTVPQTYREASFALGATKWQTIRAAVLPYALPGILTGSILGLSRACGETAPILFTGVAFYLPKLPSSIFDQFMALPYHLYILSTQHHDIEQTRPLAYGSALVLLALVLILNLSAIILRANFRKKFGKGV